MIAGVFVIVATILSGSSESIIGDAIRSVTEFVDKVALVDTGIHDRTICVAQNILGDRLEVFQFPWVEDFSKARNYSLAIAKELGASWTMTVDTDERFQFSRFKSKDELLGSLNSNHIVKTWMVPDRSGRYSKERFFRIPATVTWIGRTHECVSNFKTIERRPLEGVYFFEVPKTKEQFVAKLLRDRLILEEEVRKKPADARWWYYLGQTLEQLDEVEGAMSSFKKSVQCDPWSEQAAWAQYCIARCNTRIEKYEAGLACCLEGLNLRANSPDLVWLAGWCCYNLGRLVDAIAWANMAISLGCVEGRGVDDCRITMRHVPAWYEAPYDVLRHAYKKMGALEKAAVAESQFANALKMRREWAG